MIGIIGAGAFGTALATSLARAGVPVTLWARDISRLAARQSDRLPGVTLPENVSVTAEIAGLSGSDAVLLCLPTQAARGFLGRHGQYIDGLPVVACFKGVDLQTGHGPTALVAAGCPRSPAAVLSGPSFAADIALGKPTALTLACADPAVCEALQHWLSTPVLRIYRSSDILGVEIGGALKNVIAIAAGVVIGAGLGDSARAALVTRGFAEMRRLALALGARDETLSGLSGFGDLVLTCTSDQSRNFRFGFALGSGNRPDPSMTVEGSATAQAAVGLAERHDVDMPVTKMVAALAGGGIALPEAIRGLLARPLREE